LVGIITAFNFPAAVMGWNFALSAICGNCSIWKGAPSTNLVSIACTRLIGSVLEANKCPSGVLALVCGGVDIGESLLNDERIPLVSFTGSTKVGKIVNSKVHSRFGKTLLELGGNNAVIICEDANVDLSIKACTFAAVGSCG